MPDYPDATNRPEDLEGNGLIDAGGTPLSELLQDIDALVDRFVAGGDGTKEVDERFARFVRSAVGYCESVRGKDPESAFNDVRYVLTLCQKVAAKGGMRDASRIAYARALRSSGAIASDLYRRYSDISYHVSAIEWELEALGIIVQLEGKARGDWGLWANTLNSISVSSFRLRNYSVALPLADLAARFAEKLGNDEQELRARVLRCKAASYLAYAEDYEARLTAYVHPFEHADVPGDIEGVRGGVLEVVERASMGACEADRDRAWDAKITLAQGHRLFGNYDAAAKVLEEVIRECEDKIGDKAIHLDALPAPEDLIRIRTELKTLGRALYQLALVEEGLDSFQAAYEHARTATAYRFLIEGLDHIDVRKSYDLMKRLESCEGVHPDLDMEDYPYAIQLAQVEEHFVQGGRGLRPIEVADRIVRGDRIPVYQVFGLASEEELEGLLGRLGLSS